jgi:hypothetical protein
VKSAASAISTARRLSVSASGAAFAEFLKEDRKVAEAVVKIANSKRETYTPQ